MIVPLLSLFKLASNDIVTDHLSTETAINNKKSLVEKPNQLKIFLFRINSFADNQKIQNSKIVNKHPRLKKRQEHIAEKHRQ